MAGSVTPTQEEFVHALSTLQMILIRANYWPTFNFLNNTNYGTAATIHCCLQYHLHNNSLTGDADHLRLIKHDVNPMRGFDNNVQGNEDDLTAKLDVHGGR